MNVYESNLMKKVDEWVERHTDELVGDIKKLVRIRSVNENDSEIKPYGQTCRDVADCAAAMCAGYGFPVQNHDYRSITAIMKGKTGKRIGIFNHLDVVPEGNDWSFPPFEPFVKDGYVAGRGSSDNKGPAVASLYTMRCLSDLDIKLNHSIILFLGMAEEAGMDDVVRYLEVNPAPKFSFTPDAIYSVCHGEKGVLNARFARDIAGGNLISFRGGQVTNAVADRAEAVISGFALDEIIKATSVYENIRAHEAPGGVALTAIGIARHAAFPEGSVNAIQRLAQALSEQKLVTEPALSAMRFIAEALSDDFGTGLDIAFEDDISGRTTCIGGLAWMDGTLFTQDINIRYAISADVEELKRKLSAGCEAHGFALTRFNDSKPCYIPADNPIVLMLDQTVQEYYGDAYKPYIMGGGTYARKIPNAVGFGPDIDDEDEGADADSSASTPFNGAHQPDEGVRIETLLTAIKIYALALVRLDAML